MKGGHHYPVKITVITLAVMFLFRSPPLLFAASCCSAGATSTLAFLLPPQHSALLGLEIAGAEDLAYRRSNGDLVPLEGESHEVVTRLGAALRLGMRTQTLVSVPILWRERIASLSDKALGWGDLRVQGYYELFHEQAVLGEEGLDLFAEPSSLPITREGFSSRRSSQIVLFGGWSFPTGRSPEESTHLLGTDITGSGKHSPNLGFEVTGLWDFLGISLLLQLSRDYSRGWVYTGWGYELAALLFYPLTQVSFLGITSSRSEMRPGGQTNTGVALVTSFLMDSQEPLSSLIRVRVGTRGALGGRSNPVSLEAGVFYAFAFQ